MRLLTKLQAVTTPASVCYEIQKALAAIPDARGVDFLMSPDLEVTGNYINDTSMTNHPADGALFTWNRTPLNHKEGFRINGQQMTVYSPDLEKVVVGGLAEFTMNWRFYSSNMDILEEFELLYILGRSIRSQTVINVATTNLGDFTYTIEWEEITSLTFNQSEQFGMYLESSALVHGVFLASRARNPDDSIILKINSDIVVSPENVLTDLTLVQNVQTYQP